MISTGWAKKDETTVHLTHAVQHFEKLISRQDILDLLSKYP